MKKKRAKATQAPAPAKKPRINSNAKGKSGELELAGFLRAHGFDAWRGQQFQGGSESADVETVGLNEFHLECKRVEAGSLYTWLKQAIGDAGKGKFPVVAHRRSREEWVAIMRLEDFLFLQTLRGM